MNFFSVIYILCLVSSVRCHITPHLKVDPLQKILRGWSESQIQSIEAQNLRDNNEYVQSSPMRLVMLPEASYPHQKCLDGSQFGYYFRPAPANSPNNKKWVIVLQGGGLCVEPIDCYIRQDSDQGSSKTWQEHWVPGTDGVGDIVYDNEEQNPYFHDYNHVFLRYCTGDLWTGSMTKHDILDFWFTGHNSLKGTVDHLKETAGLEEATHVLLTGFSAGGVGTFNNADFMREKWLNPGVYFRAAPVSGMFFPGPMVLYEEWILGLNVPLNSLASLYLTNWYQSALDESCVEASAAGNFKPHRCWDASHLYQFIDSKLFLVQNQFDQLQIEDISLCPCSQINIASTRHFKEHFGRVVLQGVADTVNSTRGITKGDGAFVPSCYQHTTNLCIRGGPEIENTKLSDVLGPWFLEEDPEVASQYKTLDTCGSSLPCNTKCHC